MRRAGRRVGSGTASAARSGRHRATLPHSREKVQSLNPKRAAASVRPARQTAGHERHRSRHRAQVDPSVPSRSGRRRRDRRDSSPLRHGHRRAATCSPGGSTSSTATRWRAFVSSSPNVRSSRRRTTSTRRRCTSRTVRRGSRSARTCTRRSASSARTRRAVSPSSPRTWTSSARRRRSSASSTASWAHPSGLTWACSCRRSCCSPRKPVSTRARRRPGRSTRTR